MNNPMGRTVGVFNGIRTDTYGIKLVNINSGIQSDPFLPQQDLVMDESFYRDAPYYYKSKKSQLEFTLRFFREGYWSDDFKQMLLEMIDPENGDFVEFFTEQNPNKVYFIRYVGESNFYNAGSQGGYVDIRFRTDSPYSYSREYTVEVDNLNGNNNEIIIYNDGNIDAEPLMWVTREGDGFFRIVNESIGEEFLIENVMGGEEIYINNENGDIISSLESNDVYRYDDHNEVYLRLKPGANKLTVNTGVYVKIKYRFKYKG